MAERPPVGATFEVERVGRRRSRPSLAVLAWVGVLVAFVGLGVFGRGGDGSGAKGLAEASAAASPSGSIPATLSPAEIALLVPAPGDHVLLSDPVEVWWPAVGPVEITTPSLIVRGELLTRADSLQVSLEARNNRIIDTVTLDARDPNGGIRRDVTFTFQATFLLPNPRPNGTMWVVVTAYDASGVPIGGDRRPFLVGPIKGA